MDVLPNSPASVARATESGENRRIASPLGWAWAVLGIFALSRLATSAIVLAVIAAARPGSRIGLHAGFFTALGAWDGQWYQLIARSGYPAHLPINAYGLAQNAWAFLPAYPMLVRVLSGGDGALWPVTSVLVSVAFGLGASIVLAALLLPHVGRRGALTAVALFTCSPVGFMLQTSYAEAMGLFLTFLVLLLVDRRRYGLAIPVVAALAFTRPGLQAVAALVAVHLVLEIRAARRHASPLPRVRLISGVTLVVVAAVGGWAWPWIAAAVTGTRDAYVLTELQWRAGWTGTATLVPVQSWFFAADFWLGASGPAVLAVLVSGWTAVVLSRWGRRVGTTARVWLVVWPAYLLAVFFPQSSVFRLLMPLAPLGGAFGGLRTRTIVLLTLVSIGAQGVWFFCLYGYWSHYWTVP